MRYIDVEKDTYEAGTSYPSEAPEFTPVFVLGDEVQFLYTFEVHLIYHK
jgi:hypothetical protein